MRTYAYYRDLFEEQSLPLAYVDLDLFDENLERIAESAGDVGIRVVSSAIRCVPLLERILAFSGPFHGILCGSVREAVFLSHQGFDDILVSRAIWHEADFYDLSEELRRGKRIICSVGSEEQVERLNGLGKSYDVMVPLCIDADLSPRGRPMSHGAVGDVESAVPLAVRIREDLHVQLEGILAHGKTYQSQQPPKSWWRRRGLSSRSSSMPDRRERLVRAVVDATHELSFVNGPGAHTACGSVRGVTEVSLAEDFWGSTREEAKAPPILAVGLEVTASSKEGTSVADAGFLFGPACDANGLSWNPRWPAARVLGLREWQGGASVLVGCEQPNLLALGDPLFVRHSHASVVPECFETLFLVSSGRVIDEAPTYRGEGFCFS